MRERHVPADRRRESGAMSTRPPILKCMDCGFDLRAHATSDRCPECGRAVADSQQHLAGQATRRRRRLIVLVPVGWVLCVFLFNLLIFAGRIGLEIAGLSIGLWVFTAMAAGFAFFAALFSKEVELAGVLTLFFCGAIAIVASLMNMALLFIAGL